MLINMISKDAHLNSDVFNTDSLEQAPTRDGFGNGAVQAGEKDENVVVLCADLADSTRASWFRDKFPDRYVELGVAEQNLAALGSGMAAAGKIPFIASYAAFNPGRNNEQIRTTISLNRVPVKVCGMHAGISVGPDGATHQALEDVALMRVQPNMQVITPIDALEAKKATYAAAFNGEPTYLRYAREKSPVITTEQTPFEIGKAYELWESESPEVAFIGCGPLLYNALLAAKELEEKGVGSIVLNAHTVKPLDNEKVLEVAKKAGAVVTVEEHQVAGGLGSAVAELLSQNNPVPVEFIGVHDRFGQSGTKDDLYKEYKMDVPSIVKAAKKVIQRR